MKVPRGEVRKLVFGIAKIQNWVGAARGHHGNDRDNFGFEKGQDLLEKAFDECIKLIGEYDPVEEATPDA